jgi:vacuolar-type H+-ATPase subunit C/Vma6
MERAGARDGDAAALRALLRVEIDAANVKTALRLASAGTLAADARARYFIPGGALLSGDTFVALSSADTQTQAWQRIRVSGFPVKELPTNLVDFERELDLITAKALADRYRGDPLGVDVVVGYLAKKSAEVANLRLIARAKLLGLPRERVRREMVLA